VVVLPIFLTIIRLLPVGVVMARAEECDWEKEERKVGSKGNGHEEGLDDTQHLR
jgi:hypothetical protein